MNVSETAENFSYFSRVSEGKTPSLPNGGRGRKQRTRENHARLILGDAKRRASLCLGLMKLIYPRGLFSPRDGMLAAIWREFMRCGGCVCASVFRGELKCFGLLSWCDRGARVHFFLFGLGGCLAGCRALYCGRK